jgi:small-conductance mechanosensitive channel
MDSVTEFLSFLGLQFDWLPDWAINLGVVSAAVLLAWWLDTVIFATLERWVARQDLFHRSLTSRMRGPSLLAAVMLAIALGASIAPLTDSEAAAVRQVTIVGIVVVTGWFLLTALHVWLVIYLRRFKLDSEDNLLARKHVTQSRILERIARTLIVILTFAATLMTFDSFRQYGVGLLASAGAASLVLGLAFQPVLKNLIAAFSSPSPSRYASKMRFSSTTSGVMSRRSHRAMWLFAFGIGGA